LNDVHRNLHTKSCRCECPACSEELCKTVKPTVSSFMKHSLCPASQTLIGSNVLFYKSDCLQLKCDLCWLNRPNHILHCPLSNWTSVEGLQIIHSFAKLYNACKSLCNFFQTSLVGQITRLLTNSGKEACTSFIVIRVGTILLKPLSYLFNNVSSNSYYYD